MISVIVPIFNAEEYLDECICSIINQTYKNIEIILINDGSKDASLQICEKYKKLDNRIFVLNKENEGLVKARKDGASMAKGDYVTFLDADDWIDVETLDKCMKDKADIISYGLIEEYGYKISYKKNKIGAGYYNKEEIKKYIVPKMLCYENFFEFGVIPNMGCKIIKRDLFLSEMKGISNSVTVGEDVDFLVGIIKKANSLVLRDDCYLHYRQHRESMMKSYLSIESIRQLYEDMIKKVEFNEDELKKQIDIYIIFVLLLKRMDIIFPILTDLHMLENNVAIYGAGGFGMSVYREVANNKKINKIVIIDKCWENLQNEHFKVYDKSILFENEVDKVIISILNSNVSKMIKTELIDMGINQNKILTFDFMNIDIKRVLKLMYMN